MHWVNRGPDPAGLEPVRARYTPRWVEYYSHSNGPRPSDARWRDFHEDLSGAFFGLCAYCEELCRGEVEHFRPKSRFPELVYQWSNWVFACHDCNHAKGDKWPPGGYVDPCARSGPARPETYFEFDTLTGEIIPRAGLTPARRSKAVQMILDLRLNDHHHLRNRVVWLRLVAQALLGNPLSGLPEVEFRGAVTARSEPLSSVTRAMLLEG